MPRSYKEVEILIVKLEQSLREATLWSSNTLPVEVFQSKLPFALDTMSFEQWLQFIFIPKMTNLVNTRNPLPNNLKLMPMAERSFRAKDEHSELMKIINQIDLIFSPS
jgi:uncharacterized protein YqcC (DUF446 family)